MVITSGTSYIPIILYHYSRASSPPEVDTCTCRRSGTMSSDKPKIFSTLTKPGFLVDVSPFKNLKFPQGPCASKWGMGV